MSVLAHPRRDRGAVSPVAPAGASGEFSDIRGARAAREMRRHMALLWRAYVRANFPCPAALARAFAVDPATAENWWAGANAPMGHVVALAFQRDPEGAAAALRLAA